MCTPSTVCKAHRTPPLYHLLPQVSKTDSTVQFVPNLDGAPSATVVQADIQACQAVIHKVGTAALLPQKPFCVRTGPLRSWGQLASKRCMLRQQWKRTGQLGKASPAALLVTHTSVVSCTLNTATCSHLKPIHTDRCRSAAGLCLPERPAQRRLVGDCRRYCDC